MVLWQVYLLDLQILQVHSAHRTLWIHKEGEGFSLEVIWEWYIFTFAIGAGPVTGLIIPELSSSKTRGKIMSLSFSVHWVCNFLVGLLFLDLVEMFGVASVYAGFGSVSVLSAIFAYYFLVETKGRSLEEIEMSLNSNMRGGGR